jgi:hypothetical protein
LLLYVGVPLRIERAWVFPVGLQDALWLYYRNDTLVVDAVNDAASALHWRTVRPNVYIFTYDNGIVSEIL